MLDKDLSMEKKNTIYTMISEIRKSDFAHVNISELGVEDLGVLVSYLKASHDYYLNDCLPKLHEAVHVMLSSYDGTVSTAMNGFFDCYEKAMQDHFSYEERMLFPYAAAIVCGETVEDKPAFHEDSDSHENLENSIRDFKTLLFSYLPSESCTDVTVSVISLIFRLEEDLHKHVMIEDRLFLPLIKKLEEKA